MATFSGSQGLPLQLDISHLNEVLVLLRKCGFPDSRWFELGLALGLSKRTLDTIKANNPQDINQCLIECLSRWLERADDVISKGGATCTYESLTAAIRDMNLIAVADMLYQEKCHEASNVSTESTEDEVKQKPNKDLSSDVIYTGKMYYEKKEVNQWTTTFSVVRYMEVFQQYLDNKSSKVEQDESFVTFRFIQPDGILKLSLQDTPSLESGWTIQPHQLPMEIHQNTVEQFPFTLSCASCSISVYAEIGVAKKPLHCPIELTGIVPSMTIYVNRSPPPSPMIDSTNSSSSTASISQTRRETEEGTFRSDIAHRVMTEYTGMIKERLDLNTLVDRLLEKRMINEREKTKLLDERCGLTVNQRMDELLSLVKASIREDGEDFGLFVEIIKQENTRRTDRLAQSLLDNYKRLVIPREEDTQKTSALANKMLQEDRHNQVQYHDDTVAKWLQDSKVNLTVKRVQMLGPPGSGKTCSRHLLLNEDPPKKDNSTPIACRAVKATRISVKNCHMKEVDAKALLLRLATDLKKEVSKQKESSKKIPTQDCGKKSKGQSSETFPTDSPETKTTESADIAESKNSADDPDANKICQDIVKAISEAQVQLDRHLVYIVDSGGQTAFQELLPLFTRAASLNIITLDVSKGLDEKLDLQYRIDGEPFPCDPKFSYTNIEFIKDVLSSGAVVQPLDTQQSKEDTKALRYPEYFVLGTHKDEAKPTQIEEYNKELLSLKSGSKEKGYCIIPVKCNSNQIIYPVNTILKSGPDRQDEAKNLCEAIYNNISGDTFPMPVRWFAFELTLLEKTKGHSFLELGDVFSVGRSLQMDEDDTKKALQYLHNVTIILYYPQVLPDIVFVDPHPILDILSRLLALTYKMEWKFLRCLTKETPSPSELDNLSEKGIFTKSLLEKLNNDQGFLETDFIKLLLHLHIIVKTQDGYFIPSALPHFGPAGSIPKSDIVNPLLIVWPNPLNNKEILPVPRGIFPLTVVNLMITVNKLQFSFPPATIDAETNNTATNQESPKYFRYRNAMSFSIDDVINDMQVGTIHFIKKHRHIEIHFTGHKDDALKYCSEIREAVTEAINSSSVAINLKLSHKLAFACCFTEKCYCIVKDEAEERVRCTLCLQRAIIKGQEKYWIWFHVTCQSSTEVMTNPCTLNITLRDVRSSLKESNFFESKWLDLGDQLGLLPDTLNAIETNHSDVSRHLRETLVKWLAGADDASPSWGSLVKALEAIEENNVAEHIRCKWIKRKHT